MKINTDAVMDKLLKLRFEMMDVLRITMESKDSGEVDSNIAYGDSPDERLLEYELNRMLESLDDISCKIEYLNKPIEHTGVLKKNSSGRYELVTSSGQVVKEFTSGNRIEALIYDDFNEENTWEIRRVEHSGSDYYIVGYPNMNLEGLVVRIRQC